MARECDGPDRATGKNACPLKCRSRTAGDQVDWAGLPVNLDLVFSRKQRDRVYVQHLMRKRETKLWRHDAQPCVCEAMADGRFQDAAEQVSSR
ncbi:hypothetical protein [Mycobacterium parmense]|uniref:hypothetical protein n=1 Tax=Mycobacterium parmense TaxID=185642 RepID=UPI0026B1FD0C